MALGREKGFVDFVFWISTDMAQLCVEALEAGIETEYVQNLIRKRHLTPASPPVGLNTWPWAVKITTLGPFGLEVDGRPLHFGRKIPRKPLLLLKALIAFGGQRVGDTQLADALWPDVEGDLAQQALYKALQRLRKWLGTEELIQLRDGKITLNPYHCWVDAWAFEHLLDRAKVAERKDDLSRSRNLAKRALALYHQPFLLEDLNQHWTHPLRNRLESKIRRYD